MTTFQQQVIQAEIVDTYWQLLVCSIFLCMCSIWAYYACKRAFTIPSTTMYDEVMIFIEAISVVFSLCLVVVFTLSVVNHISDLIKLYLAPEMWLNTNPDLWRPATCK